MGSFERAENAGFRDAFDVFVKELREQGLLKDRSSMNAYCNQHRRP